MSQADSAAPSIGVPALRGGWTPDDVAAALRLTGLRLGLGRACRGSVLNSSRSLATFAAFSLSLFSSLFTPVASAQIGAPPNTAPFIDAIVVEPIFLWSTCGHGGTIPCETFDNAQDAVNLELQNTNSPCGQIQYLGYVNKGNSPENGRYGVQWSATIPNPRFDVHGYLTCGPDLIVIGDSAELVWYCPENFSAHSWTSPGLPGLTLACTKPATVRTPCVSCDDLRAMQYGNPMSISDGVKLQREVDLPASTTHGLSFTRTFRSDLAGFDSEYSGEGFSVGPASVENTQCLFARYFNRDLNAWAMGCAPYLRMWNDGYVYRNAASPYVQFWQAPGSTTVSAFLGVLEQLVRRSDDGSSIVRTPAGALESFSPSGSLTLRSFADGALHTLAYSDQNTPWSTAPWPGLLISVSDTFGRILRFTYDSSGHLAALTDPAGFVYRYSVNSTASVIQVQYPDQTTRNYLYNESANVSGADLPLALTGIIDEIGKRFANYAYHSDGTVAFSEHAGGVDHYDTAIGGTTTVTLPDGELRTYQVATFGRFRAPVQVTRSCRGCQTASTSYGLDTSGNALSILDFNGNRSCFAYDVARTLEVTRVEGLTAGSACATYLPDGSTLPAGSRKVTTQWHPQWRLPILVVEPGRKTTNVYNGQSDPIVGGTASCPGTGVTLPSLPDGTPLALLCKKVEQATTDVDGHLGLGATLDATVPARQWSYTYNPYGQVLTAKGPRTDVDDVTTYTYYPDTSFTGADPNAVGHSMGDLYTVLNAVGKTTTYDLYNKNGQLLQSTDANGVVTQNTYDARQRLVTASVGGQTTKYEYWPTGLLQRVSQLDADNNPISFIQYTYDDAHRLHLIQDNLNNSITYTLDNSGNRTAEVVADPANVLRRQIHRDIDALGRVQQITGRE